MPEIRNLPTDYMAKRYIVVREFENEDWYWGSYASKEAAVFVSGQCFGKVYDTKKNKWVER